MGADGLATQAARATATIIIFLTMQVQVRKFRL